jgi:hypothetical protein
MISRLAVGRLVGFALEVINSTSSLCNLCLLCASAVVFCGQMMNHRDTEHTDNTAFQNPFE